MLTHLEILQIKMYNTFTRLKGDESMNISSLGGTNISLSDTKSMNMIDVAILKKSLSSMETNGEMITKMMEQSVNPNIGSNIDIRL